MGDGKPCTVGGRRRTSRRGRSWNVCQKGLLEELQTTYDSIDILQWEDDDIALRLAAAKSRLPYDRPTSQEMATFPELSSSKSSIDLFLYLRNKVLQQWHRNPRNELMPQDILDVLPSPYDSDPLLLRRIFEFLQRFGYINVGIFSSVTLPRKPYRKRVIIIGAGIAGIIAARQLKYFGVDVVVLEARLRAGGRVSTYIKPDENFRGLECNPKACQVAELGASFIYGAFGNPLMTLTQQCDVLCIPVCLEQCPIYDPAGRAVERRRTLLVERAFNRIIYAATYMAHTKGITDSNNRKLSLGETFTTMLEQHDYHLQTKRISYFESYQNILNKLKAVQDTMVIKKNEIIHLNETYSDLKDKENRTDLGEEERMENEIMLKCVVKDIRDAIKIYNTCSSKRKDIDTGLADLSKNEPSEVYMNEFDRRMLDFHIANLEYTIGASINDASLKDWNHNADYELEGPNMYIADGLVSFVDALKSGVNIEMGHVVEHVEYGTEGVKVTSLFGGKRAIFRGDVCLCTVPLGVLKRSVRNMHSAPKFSPELPRWKTDAINSLGFGNVNKIVLIFEKPFWENIRVFGHLSDTIARRCAANRGEMFMFQALSDKPVLIALVSGDAANAVEEVPDQFVVAKAMNFLSAVFGSACPKEPMDVIITRWRGDIFSGGSFSYVPPNCAADAYDALAQPVKDSSGYDRIFFAGEHTNRQHPASVHGAYLSGLREAGRIADQLIGCPYGVVD